MAFISNRIGPPFSFLATCVSSGTPNHSIHPLQNNCVIGAPPGRKRVLQSWPKYIKAQAGNKFYIIHTYLKCTRVLYMKSQNTHLQMRSVLLSLHIGAADRGVCLQNVAKCVSDCGIQPFNSFLNPIAIHQRHLSSNALGQNFLTTDQHLWMDLINKRWLVNHRLVIQRKWQYNACHCGSKLQSSVVQHRTYL